MATPPDSGCQGGEPEPNYKAALGLVKCPLSELYLWSWWVYRGQAGPAFSPVLAEGLIHHREAGSFLQGLQACRSLRQLLMGTYCLWLCPHHWGVASSSPTLLPGQLGTRPLPQHTA